MSAVESRFTGSGGLWLACTTALVFGCSSDAPRNGPELLDGDEPLPIAEVRPGRLALQCLGECGSPVQPKAAAPDPERGRGQPQEPQVSTLHLDLGDVYATKDFLFLLANSGDTDVTDITLQSSDPRFSVEPPSIALLPPREAAAVLPILRVWTTHGTSRTGIGYEALLTPGVHSTKLSVSGTTTDGQGQSSGALFELELDVFARIMDFELSVDGDPVQPDSHGAGSSVLGGLGFVRSYRGDSASILNTGNVALELSHWREDGLLLDSSTLDVGGTWSTQVRADQSHCYSLQGHAAADPLKFQLGNDGAAYFCVRP